MNQVDISVYSYANKSMTAQNFILALILQLLYYNCYGSEGTLQIRDVKQMTEM